LSELAQKPKRGGFIPFADPDDGKQVYFKRHGQGQFNTEYLSHQFLDRNYKIDDKTLDDAMSLDESIIILTYEEFNNKYWGTDGEKKVDEEKEAEPKTSKRSARKPPVKEEENKDEKQKEETKDTPTPRRTRTRAKKEEPEEKPEEKPSDNKCPAGGVFGVDIDKPLPECDNCEVWDDCGKEADNLESKKKVNKSEEDDIPF
jgi:hypothetical protein